MAFPSTKLDLIVQIALGADLSLPSASWSWTDVTRYVFVRDGVAAVITRGRGDWYAEVPPSQVSFYVDNRDGRWCRTNPTGAWYGQLAKSTPVRIRVNNGSGYVTRFTGFIDGLPLRWDKSGRYADAQITASGILRRIAGKAPLRSALYRTLTNSGNSSVAVAYWPGEDASGSTQVASALGGPPMQVTGSVSFAADSDIAGSDPLMQLPTAARVVGAVPVYATSTTWAVRFVCSIPAAPAGTTILADWRTPGGTVGEWQIWITPGAPDTVRLLGFNNAGTDLVLDSGVSFVDSGGTELYGRQVYWEINATQNGANVDWDYNFWFASGTGAAGFGGTGSVAGTIANVNQVFFTPDSNLDGITIGHIGVGTNSSYGAGSYGATGYAGEQSNIRLFRIATEEALPADSSSNAAALMGAQQTDTLINQLRQVGAAEGTAVYEQLDGDLIVPDRRGLYNQTVALTLDFDQGQVAESPDPVDDDQTLRNDVTVARPRGSSARAIQTTGPNNVSAIGSYADSQTLNVAADSDLPYRAQWLRHLGTTETFRYPQIQLNFARATSKINAWLACDIFSRIQLTNPPDGLPPDAIDLLLQGYTETLGPYRWDVTLNCSPYEPWEVFQLEDDNDGRVDTQGSELLVGVTSGATSWLVATTTCTGQPNAIQWSTTQEPYYWWVAGEKVRADTVNTNAAAFVAAGTAQHGNNASVTPGMPAGVQAGDLLLVFAAIRNSGTGTVNTPTGYTQLLSFGNMALLGKIHTGTESAPTITFTGGVANADTSAQMAAFRYAQLSVVSSATQLNGSAQNIATPALNGIDRGRMVILYLGWKQDDWTSVSSPGTEIGEPFTTTGDDQGIVWSYTIQTTPAAIASTSFVVTGGLSAISRGAVVALKGDVQSCTVTRAINGVVKAQTTGTDISLWRPGTGGLAL